MDEANKTLKVICIGIDGRVSTTEIPDMPDIVANDIKNEIETRLKLATFIKICEANGITPKEAMQLSDRWTYLVHMAGKKYPQEK